MSEQVRERRISPAATTHFLDLTRAATTRPTIILFSEPAPGKQRLQVMPTHSSVRARGNKTQLAERMFSSGGIQGFPIRRASPILSSEVRLVPPIPPAALIRSSDAA